VRVLPGRPGVWSVLVLALLGCTRPVATCATCVPVVIAATGEPNTLLPPLVFETVGRDISDLVFERLADLAAGAAPIDSSAYRPRLAERWERVDEVTWRFHLRPGARWHDGHPVTADDVVFSFEAFTDSTIGAVARSYLGGKVSAAAEDSVTVLVRFREPSPEQLYDATFHVRIFPRHIWDTIPKARWEGDTAVGHLVGSGPYRVTTWRRGQFVILDRDPSRAPTPEIRRAIWRFAPDPDAALNLVLGHEADLLESVGAPDRVRRVNEDSSLRAIPYPAATYGFLAFRVADARGRPHPVLGRREVRRALGQAVDRRTLALAFFGPETKVPPGPMSQLLWIWSDSIRALPFDTAAAARALARARGRGPLGPVDILVPATSSTRRQMAVAVQEAWRRIGVESSVTAVDFPTFQERLAAGRFDSYIGAYLDEPSPRGLADQWSRRGWEVLNYGRYANPVFDSLLSAASRQRDVGVAGRLWREAMDTLNADAPAIFLYAPANVAAVARRLEGVRIDPYSWVSGLPRWKIDSTAGSPPLR